MPTKASYEYLLAYKITVIVYDYTVIFCKRYISPFSRTTDQMIQAARSGMQNIAEGSKQESLKGYIKLSGVSRGSLEELLKDYVSYARQRNIPLWGRDKVTGEIKEMAVIWGILKKNPYLPDQPNFPNLPLNEQATINLLITLIHQANYLLDRLIISLKQKHEREGELSEELFRKRLEYKRKYY